ncbi:MAG TPA: hypothetical protein ENJ46_05280 [Hellea balneolensis]|uniref:Uncharacterized protein n=1 Tax=Hellea balneolensis TaxID=287478 RepID=A0A7C3GLZ6_9PROT|nr:hypothetical protein [Hellea balneolensis]
MKMYQYMRASALSVCVMAFMQTRAWADDNIADCELVVQKPIPLAETSPERDTETAAKPEQKQALIATFLPAYDFIYSVFDGEEGHIRDIDGQEIKALMCKRADIIPSMFDVKLIETGIPFYLSQDFDSATSALIAITKKDDKFVVDYVGTPLSSDDQDRLDFVMKNLNGAEHNSDNKGEDTP